VKIIKSRTQRIFAIIFLVIILVPCVDILVPIINPNYIPDIYIIENYIEEYSHLPSSEYAYLQWAKISHPRSINLPFNILYGVSVEDLEIKDDRLVYKEIGEPCRLIYGGKSIIHDIFMGWKYRRVSKNLFELMQNSVKFHEGENNQEEPNNPKN